MAQKQVIWAPRAKDELRQVLTYYNEQTHSNKYSLKLLHEVDTLIDLIQRHNFIGRLTSDEQARVIPFEHYLLFYELDKERIYILSVWDNRQDLKKRADQPVRE